MTEGEDELAGYRKRAGTERTNTGMERFLATVMAELESTGADVQPSQSYWYYRPSRGFPPEAVRYPSDYDGGDRINISCTQTDLKDSEQKKLVRVWCQTLPELDQVEYVWFSSRCNQPLFNAVTRMARLKGLYIKWSGITAIDAIADVGNLKYLHIGSSPSIAPLEPLAELRQLQWLELENIRACADLSFVAGLTGLKGLAINGDGNSLKYLRVKTLEPIRHLQDLYWLSLSTSIIGDGRLRPLADLGNLKYLFLSNKHEMEEVARLAGLRPDIECEWFAPVSEIYDCLPCRKCGRPAMVLPTGKGKPWMCTICDQEKIRRHVESFNAIAELCRSRDAGSVG